MVAQIQRTRALYESYLSRNADGTPRTSNPGAARAAFVNDFRHRLGLCDRQGNNYTDDVGNRVLRECPEPSARLKSNQFSFLELAESIIGPEVRQFLESGESYAMWRAQNYHIDRLNPNDPRALLEAPGIGISPSAFADVNAWTAINSGLIERRILEPFQNPEFIGSIICPDEMTRIAEGQKVTGVSRLGNVTAFRDPGQPHARAGLQERWVQLPRTNERALATDVTFEAGFFDMTGQVLDHAGDVGTWLAYASELDCIDAVLGVSTATGLSTAPNAFNYKGTTYAQFQSSAVTASQPMPINTQSNGLTNGDWTTIKNSWLLAKRMTSPEELTRIDNDVDTILSGLEGALTADLIIGATDTQRRTAINGGTQTQSGAETLTIQNTPENLARTRFGVKRVLTSPLVDQRMTDSTGLNLSTTNAASYWFHLAAGKSHRRMVNWPLTLTSVPAQSSYEMTDRRLIQSTFASLRYVCAVRSLWAIIRNTN